jgi:hypothetical protein
MIAGHELIGERRRAGRDRAGPLVGQAPPDVLVELWPRITTGIVKYGFE